MDDPVDASPRWRRALARSPRQWSLVWRISVPVACACAGLLATTSMVNARGTDLRGGRHSDLIELVGAQRQEVAELRQETESLQQRIDGLTAEVGGDKVEAVQEQVDALSTPAGLEAMQGPGIVVSLDDAPDDQEVPEGVNPNVFVVHQQDIQAVLNAFWAGGAEAVSLQGQRIISTTGVKCVGNTVVLQGVPYAPPYRIVALGNVEDMYAALTNSPEVANYRSYTAPPYNLGFEIRQDVNLVVPAFTAPVQLTFAQPAG
ncbi:MAG: DUF881 domain-containing protein [Nocardioidaceae bacterium]|nr:DUF881 domain-containing protein [Nocardioidaceae bacterium]